MSVDSSAVKGLAKSRWSYLLSMYQRALARKYCCVGSVVTSITGTDAIAMVGRHYGIVQPLRWPTPEPCLSSRSFSHCADCMIACATHTKYIASRLGASRARSFAFRARSFAFRARSFAIRARFSRSGRAFSRFAPRFSPEVRVFIFLSLHKIPSGKMRPRGLPSLPGDELI